jgi:hypothetical protein
VRNVTHRDRSPYPAERLRHRGRGILRALTLAVPASLLVLGMTAAGAASAATSRPASAGQALAKAASTPDYKAACAAAQAGQASCLTLVRTNVAHHLQAAAAGPGATAAAAAPTGDGYGPSSLQSAYKLPSATAGLGQTVAVVEAYNDPDTVANLAAYRAAWGQPACNTSTGAGCLTIVNQNGAATPLPPASPPDDDWAAETSVDIDMVSAICPNCHILMVEATNDEDSDLPTAVNTAVNLGAKFIATSYGNLETSSASEDDVEYYNHPGVVITAAAGSDGFGAVEYPASSPDVISVGGTTLTAASNARGWTETVWGSSGSSCSSYESKPSWQTDTGCTRRTSNDVAADANPSTGVAAYDSYSRGGWFEAGGTGVASAIIAATYALAGTPAAGTYPASYLYAHTSSLFDVTSGSDGSCFPAYLCAAGTGYDGPTGLGTPDGITAFTPASSVKSGGSELKAGQVLQAGQDLVSPNGQYTLTMQTSGNVVVSGNNCVIWSSGTSGTGNYLTMQTDGNLVIYSSAGKALWSSGTKGTVSANYLSLQNDGNTIVYTSTGKIAWAAGRANADRLCTGGVLHAGQALYSPSERYELTMQTDGNLVAYDNGKAIWASGTWGSGGADYLTMQTDGNLVVYTSSKLAIWTSGTQGTGSADYLVMQDDGNVAVYTSAGIPVWASGTSGK